MTRVRLKSPPLRLDPDVYEQLRNQVYVVTVGDANLAARLSENTIVPHVALGR
jgi:hypothetical protein